MSFRWFRMFLLLSIICVVVLSILLFDSVRESHVFPSVSFNGEVLSRQSQERVQEQLDSIEQIIFEQPIVFTVREEIYQGTLDELGFTFNKEIARDDIFSVGHKDPFGQRLLVWGRSWLGKDTSVALGPDIFYLDYEVFDLFIESHSVAPQSASEPFIGSMIIQGNGIFAQEPRDGFGINTDSIREDVIQLLQKDKPEIWLIDITTTVLPAPVSSDVFDEYRRSIISYLSGEFGLRFQQEELFVWNSNELFSLLEIIQKDSGWFLRIQQDKQEEFLRDLLAQNALFVVTDNYLVDIDSSRKGLIFDQDSFVEMIHAAFDNYRTMLELSTQKNTDPEVTTEDLQEMGVSHVIASFTTHYDCCQNRVTNIKRIADMVNGAIILPGESFELNEYVGQRTRSKGFVAAGALFFGEHVDDVGGGISQFATTLYNAIYWSGLQIDSHKPHSQYFSRYPEGIEATVSWKYPTLGFTNNYTTPVVVQTSATDTALTVMILGNNDGRILVGDHQSGATNIRTIDPGGEKSRLVLSEVSPRYNIKIAPIRYVAYPEKYLAGEQQITESGKEGWNIDVRRTIFFPELKSLKNEKWTVVYTHPTIIQVHSCDQVADTSARCFGGH